MTANGSFPPVADTSRSITSCRNDASGPQVFGRCGSRYWLRAHRSCRFGRPNLGTALYGRVGRFGRFASTGRLAGSAAQGPRRLTSAFDPLLPLGGSATGALIRRECRASQPSINIVADPAFEVPQRNYSGANQSSRGSSRYPDHRVVGVVCGPNSSDCRMHWASGGLRHKLQHSHGSSERDQEAD